MSEKELLLPDIGDFDTVEIIEMHVVAGDTVKVEDPLLTLESDKATMDIPSPFAGTITQVSVAVGDKVSEGSKLGVIETSEATAGSQPPTKAQKTDSSTEQPAKAQKTDSSAEHSREGTEKRICDTRKCLRYQRRSCRIGCRTGRLYRRFSCG